MDKQREALQIMIAGGQALDFNRDKTELSVNRVIDEYKKRLDQKTFAYLLATLTGHEQTILKEIREERMRALGLITDTRPYEFYQKRFDREVEEGYIKLKGTNIDEHG